MKIIDIPHYFVFYKSFTDYEEALTYEKKCLLNQANELMEDLAETGINVNEIDFKIFKSKFKLSEFKKIKEIRKKENNRYIGRDEEAKILAIKRYYKKTKQLRVVSNKLSAFIEKKKNSDFIPF